MKRHLTQQEKQALLDEFKDYLNDVTTGKVSFTKEIKLPEKIKVYYTPEAFSKTVRLIMSHSMEVAWHCLVRKKDQNYEVYDVLSYPQTVGPAHVHVKMGRTFGDGNPKDPTKYYTDWYNDVVLSMPEEEEANLCGQCHSHVNMGTSPSTTDMAQQKEELELKGGKGYYLFQIWNKRLEVNSFLYDLDAGVIYEKDDIEVVVEEDSFTEMSHKMLYEPEPVKPVESKEKKYDGEEGENYKYWRDKDHHYSYSDWSKRLKDYNQSYYYDDYDEYYNLNNYSICVVSEDDVAVEFIIEAYNSDEAEKLFSMWAIDNVDYIKEVLEDAGAKQYATYRMGSAKRVGDKEIVDITYDELIGADYI